MKAGDLVRLKKQGSVHSPHMPSSFGLIIQASNRGSVRVMWGDPRWRGSAPSYWFRDDLELINESR